MTDAGAHTADADRAHPMGTARMTDADGRTIIKGHRPTQLGPDPVE
jgi:hypothetical protein